MALTLEIVTPERPLLSTEADEVVLPALDGEIGVLPGHAPLMSQMSVGGILSYKNAGKETVAFVSQGFVEIASDRVTVLAERAELATEIDLDAARAALKEAEVAVQKAEKENSNEVGRLQADLEGALARVKAAERTQR